MGAPDDPEWHPRNVAHGGDLDPSSLTLRDALADSNNAAAAALMQRVGTGQVLRLSADAGLTQPP